MPAEKEIPKNITPQIAVLSLVVQEPDTVAGVSRRLKEQFPAARFPESSAHNNMRSLAATGHIRLVEEGTEPPFSYEATVAGDELSRKWIWRSTPPMMRDPLQGKLAFVGYKQIAARRSERSRSTTTRCRADGSNTSDSGTILPGSTGMPSYRRSS